MITSSEIIAYYYNLPHPYLSKICMKALCVCTSSINIILYSDTVSHTTWKRRSRTINTSFGRIISIILIIREIILKCYCDRQRKRIQEKKRGDYFYNWISYIQTDGSILFTKCSSTTVPLFIDLPLAT